MAKRILVPLDGTEETEAGLDLIADAARGGGATVRLLHVAPPADNVYDLDGHVIAYADQEAARMTAEANDYLLRAAARVSRSDGADLIAMTARPTHRLTHLVLGTTTGQVCRRADVPVMVFRARPKAS